MGSQEGSHVCVQVFLTGVLDQDANSDLGLSHLHFSLRNYTASHRGTCFTSRERMSCPKVRQEKGSITDHSQYSVRVSVHVLGRLSQQVLESKDKHRGQAQREFSGEGACLECSPP